MKKKIYYVLSSHWDREWYQTFQDYRYRLVGLVDDLLESLENGQLKGPFYSDGQACVLDDYLEVYPEKQGIIKERLQNGQIVSGPWYVLPDEFLVSGESLIRNLQLGMKTLRGFGVNPSKAGFLCDMFGHISQMPQIFHLFGIQGIFLWRGVNVDTRLVVWEGADGTTQPMYVCGDYGYGAYAFVRGVHQIDQFFDNSRFQKDLGKYIKLERAKNPAESILLFDGLDHQNFDKDSYNSLLDYCSEHCLEMVHTSLDDYFASIEEEKDNIRMRIKGQLRQVTEDYHSESHLIFGVLSSRIDIKQENSYCENMLCRWAEPFSLLANLYTGKRTPDGFLNTAWKWLIKNQPHDSICGCSIDQVHEDMKFRFSQSRQIAERITEESLKTIALQTDYKIGDNELKIVIFNPLTQEHCGVVTIDLQIPVDWPVFQEFFGFEKLPAFRIYDTDGVEIPYQRVAQQVNCVNKIISKEKLPGVWYSTSVTIAIDISLPSMGYKTLVIKQAADKEPVRHPLNDDIIKSNGCLENSFLKVTIEKDGSVALLDKRSRQLYPDLMTFEDSADIGDGWFHGMAVNDQSFTSIAANSQVSIVTNGPELATLKVSKIMNLPESFCFSSMTRSDSLREFVIDNYITLRKNSDRLEIETRIDNHIEDHRLRVLFPTCAQTDMFFADSVFDVVQYPIAVDKDNYKKKELQTDTRPQQNWTAICDSQRNLAVLSPGQYETAVSDDEFRTIKLTLFRSTRRTVMTNGEPGGQLIKPLKFKYWLVPFSNQIDYYKLFNDSSCLANGIKSVQLRKQEIDLYSNEICCSLPNQQGAFSVTSAVMTSIRHYGNSIQLRIYNPCAHEQNAEIEFLSSEMRSYKSAVSVDFEGNADTTPIVITDNQVTVKMKSKQIITLCLR